MAANRAAPSRAAVLAQWERAEDPLAPLSAAQRDGILEVTERAAARPLPGNLLPGSSSSAGDPMTASTYSSGRHQAASNLSDVASTGATSEGGASSRRAGPGGGHPAAPSSSSVAPEDNREPSLHLAVARLQKKGRRVDTGHQFLEWLHQVEENLQFQEDAPYREYIGQLERHRGDLGSLLSEVEGALGRLSTLGEQYEFVSTRSNSLHEACQHLLQEQERLSELSEQVKEKLVYFTEADRINQKLTGSTAISANSDTFFQLLDRIDECMLYVLDHPTYKQSTVYRVKYQACLSRALGLIRSHVKTSLEGATSAAAAPSPSSPGGPGSAPVTSTADAAFTLFYGKFRAQAPRVTRVLSAVETRISNLRPKAPLVPGSPSASSPPSGGSSDVLWQEYESVLFDCHAVYFGCRGQLLAPSVRSAIGEMEQKYRRDHCGLVRAGCAFLLHVCEDEYQLFHQFFQGESDSLSTFLESLCQVLYDTLRPLVIHLHHLETLSELTGILRSEMLGHHVAGAGHPPQLAAFERVISQLLQDVQERLVYRAHIYVRTDILGYSPAMGDLAYPEKLEMMEAIAESVQLQQQQSQESFRQRKNSNSSLVSATSMEVAQINGRAGSHASSSPADLHGMWYPPVRRTLVCLSKLYRCLDRETFQGLSQEALTACMDSVALAADQIAANNKAKGKEGADMDARLFRIKHLLILREQIAPFHVDFSVRELGLDFSKVKTAAVSLFTTKRAADMLSLSSNNALLEFLLEGTMPEVKEYCRDSRKEVDRQLKAVCEAFISASVAKVAGPVQDFLRRVEEHRRTDKTLNISREPWGTPDALQRAASQAQRELKKHFPVVQRAMQLYLANRETEFILFRPIRNNVMSAFISFLQLTRQDYTPDQQIIIGCPSQEQIAVMITSLQLQPKTPRTSVSRDPASPIRETTSPPEDKGDPAEAPAAEKENGGERENDSVIATQGNNNGHPAAEKKEETV